MACVRFEGVLVVLLLSLALVGVSGSSASRRPSWHLQHVFVIMLENHSDESVVGDANASFITTLANKYAHVANYFGVTHTSLPNYIAATSGSNWWVNNDDPGNRFGHKNLIDQLEANHMTWAAYMESMPVAGYLGSYYPPTIGLYVNRHNPFILYTDIRSKAARRAHIKPYTRFVQDMRRSRVPNFVWISPNICHDMHGGVTVTVAPGDGSPCPKGYDDPNDVALKQKADAFVARTVKIIMASPAWREPSAIFILSDETTETGQPRLDGYKDANACCDSPVLPPGTQLLTGDTWPGGPFGGGSAVGVVVANRGKRHFTSRIAFNHYSLLATIEKNWNLGYLAYAADRLQVPTMERFLMP